MNLKGMLDRKLVQLVAAPILRRVGTAVAAYLIASDIPKDTVEAFTLWAAAGGGVLFDLVLAYFGRKSTQKQAIASVFDSGAFAEIERSRA